MPETYIIAAQYAEDFSISIDLHEEALFHVLEAGQISCLELGRNRHEGVLAHLFEFGLSLRHGCGCGQIEKRVKSAEQTQDRSSADVLCELCVWTSRRF